MKTSIHIRVSKEKKEEMVNFSKKLGQTIGIKVSLSAYILWLHENYSNKSVVYPVEPNV